MNSACFRQFSLSRLSRPLPALAVGLVLLTTCVGAQAAESADLTVKGMIRPSACNIILSGNGQIDYGMISGPELAKKTVLSSLGVHNLNLLITCDVATRIGFSVADNRPGTVNLPSAGVHGFGLGLAAGKKIGGYMVVLMNPVTSDQGTVQMVSSSDKGKNWEAPSLRNLRGDGIDLHSWSSGSRQSPLPYRTITQPLKVEAFLPPANELPPLDAPIQLDGSATFSLVYL